MTTDAMLDPCGCCARQPCVCTGSGQAAANRPGLPAIRYRLGTHSSFLRTMVDGLPAQTVTDGATTSRPLAQLTARGSDDPAIALLDSFAVVCDVLAFYQERIANEGYLRTATERRSVLELAREIGYELSPGVAAATYLAFTVEDAPSAPQRAIVPVGTRVQSVPGPGETPQVFETMQTATVRAEWNALVPIQKHVQRLRIDDGKLDVDGVEVREIYLAGTGLNLKVGDVLLVVQGGETLPLAIAAVTEDAASSQTRVDLGDRQPLPTFHVPSLPAGTVTEAPIPQTLDNVRAYILGQTWEDADLDAFLTAQKWDRATMLTQVQTLLAAEAADAKVYTFRQRVGFFGASAPAWASLALPPGHTDDGDATPQGYPKDWDDPPISIWRDGTTPDWIVIDISVSEPVS